MTILAANVTSWSNVRPLLEQADHDIVLLQETKASPAQVQQYNAQQRPKYRMLAHPASRHDSNDARHRTGGVAIAVRSHVALHPVDNADLAERAVAGIIRHAAFGEITLVSSYAPVGGSLHAGSPAENHLLALWDLVHAQRRPFIIGGISTRRLTPYRAGSTITASPPLWWPGPRRLSCRAPTPPTSISTWPVAT